MTWLALLVAALGGGILATLLKGWASRLRAYEIARLQVLDDLDSINAMSGALRIAGHVLTSAEHDRMRYPTQTWSRNRAAMVTRLERDHPDLLKRLSALFATLRLSPLAGPLEDQIQSDLERAHHELTKATLSRPEELWVYGLRYAGRRHESGTGQGDFDH